jgi:hypothetical protein
MSTSKEGESAGLSFFEKRGKLFKLRGRAADADLMSEYLGTPRKLR